MVKQPRLPHRRTRKKLPWLIGALLVFLLPAGTFFLLSTQLIRQVPVAEKIKAALSQIIGGEADYRRIDLEWFPRPKLSFHDGRLSLPGPTTIKFVSLTAFPEIFPLLTGKFRLAGLIVEGPDVEIRLPGKRMEQEGASGAASLKTAAENLGSLFGYAQAASSGGYLRVKQGRMHILDAENTAYRFWEIDASIEMPKNNVAVDVRCRSNLWEQMSMRGRMGAHLFKGRGDITLKGLKTGFISEYLSVATGIEVEMPPLDLTSQFESFGFHLFKASLGGMLPPISLKRGRDNLIVQGKRLNGTIYLDRSRSSFTLSELVLDNPRLKVSGKLETGPLHKMQTSPVDLELKGNDIDVASFRKAALTVFGDHSVVRNVSDIIINGHVPHIVLSTSGETFEQMVKSGSIIVNGRIAEGNIYVPGAILDLKNVWGDVSISEGILSGTNLSAQLGNTRGSNGKLLLDLGGRDLLLKLHINVEADLAQLPPLLKRWVGSDMFITELDQLDYVEGRATGQLFLKGGGKWLETRVAVSAFDLTADYRRLPGPIEVMGDGFSYDSGVVTVKNLSGRLGTSLFADFSARANWKNTPQMEILSGTAEIRAEEIYPWLRSFEALKSHRKFIENISGPLFLSALTLNGPIFDPGRWRFETRGSVENFAIAFTSGFSGPLRIEEGYFHLVENGETHTLTLNDVRTKSSDTALTISGVLHNPLEALQKADIRFEGDMHAEVIEWLLGILRLPPALALRAPLSVSHSRLVWTKGSRTTFKGGLSIENGPDLKVDMLLSPTTFKINELQIRDGESQALFRLNKTANVYHTTFSGRLTCNTLSKLFEGYPRGDGWIQGDIRVDFNLGQPLDIAAEGRLNMRNIDGLSCFSLPLQIERISLDARGTLFSLDETIFSWKGRRFSLKGEVEYTMQKWLLDLSASVDGLNWDRFKQQLTARGDSKKDSPLSEFLKEMPIRGNISVTAGKFTIEPFTWSPMHADIIFHQSGMDIAVAEARICGIDTPGVVKIIGADLKLEFEPSSRNQDVAPTVACLRKGEVLSSGKFDLSGRITAQAETDQLMEALKGTLEYRAREGRIYRHIPLARLFAYLDVIGIFKQIIPRMRAEGFPYRSILLNGKIEKNKLIITEGIIDSPILGIVLQGNIDLTNFRLDLDVLAAPMQSINYVIEKVPVVNQIMGGTLISIPIKITGAWSDPQVTPLHPKMVVSRLIGIMKRTLQLPIKLIQPIIPGKAP